MTFLSLFFSSIFSFATGIFFFLSLWPLLNFLFPCLVSFFSFSLYFLLYLYNILRSFWTSQVKLFRSLCTKILITQLNLYLFRLRVNFYYFPYFFIRWTFFFSFSFWCRTSDFCKLFLAAFQNIRLNERTNERWSRHKIPQIVYVSLILLCFFKLERLSSFAFLFSFKF